MNDQVGGMILLTLLVLGIVFLIAREIVCWYFKINTMVKQMDMMVQHLEIISKSLQPETPQVPAAPILAPTVRPKPEPGMKPKIRW